MTVTLNARYLIYPAIVLVAFAVAFTVITFIAGGTFWLENCPAGSKMFECDMFGRILCRVLLLGGGVILSGASIDEITRRMK